MKRRGLEPKIFYYFDKVFTEQKTFLPKMIINGLSKFEHFCDKGDKYRDVTKYI